jgi:hypothetical protein
VRWEAAAQDQPDNLPQTPKPDIQRPMPESRSRSSGIIRSLNRSRSWGCDGSWLPHEHSFRRLQAAKQRRTGLRSPAGSLSPVLARPEELEGTRPVVDAMPVLAGG